MGFECGFSFIPRLGYDTDVENFKRYHSTALYLNYTSDKYGWYQKNFSTFEKYYDEACPDELKIPDFKVNGVDEDELAQFKRKFDLDGPYDGYDKTIEFWCSIGRNIDEELFEHNELGNSYEIVDSKFMTKLNEFINENVDRPLYTFEDLTFDKGFIIKKDEDDPDEEVIISKKIDGIEAQTSNGIERIYSNSFEYGDYLLHGDIEYVNLMNNLIKARDIIELINKDYLVYYWRSY